MKANPKKTVSRTEQEMREADLTEFDRVEQIPDPVRGLPAKYGIKKHAMQLTWAAGTLREKLDDSDPKIVEKAKRELQRAYFILLNLMRLESGMLPSMIVPEEWSVDELIGTAAHGKSNMGNARLRSRHVSSDEAATRYASAKDAEPGVQFRLLGYKGNIFVYLESLRYYGGENLNNVQRQRVEMSDRHKSGKEVLSFVDAEMTGVAA